MSSIVLELRQEVLKPDCDILNALRKAHVIASKLKLQEFDAWIMHELNGYPASEIKNMPEYRKVRGRLKAWNPSGRWVPVLFKDSEIETRWCAKFVGDSICEIIGLYQNDESYVLFGYSANAEREIDKISSAPFATNYALFVSAHVLKSIVDKVANCLLEWTIRLENEGILGQGMCFSQEEAGMAKKLPQTINNYYGNVINGDVKQSQVVSGDHNTVSFNYEQVNDMLQKVKEVIKDELSSPEDRESAEELIAEVETKISAQAKPNMIKAALAALREFLICSGANVAGGLILPYLQQTLS